MQKTIVLTFDDACVNHLDFAVPILKKYGFGATFFVCCRDVWCRGSEEYFLDGKGFSAIHQAGFEIGNHTYNHAGLQDKSDEFCREEIGKLNDYLTDYDIPTPVSFAYPGGPYAANAVKIIQEFGLQTARTGGRKPWNKSITDPMQVPAYSVNAKEEINFQKALNDSVEGEDCAVVLVYHGIPDIAHPWCSTPPEMFEKHMKFLSDNDFRVVSMKDFFQKG